MEPTIPPWLPLGVPGLWGAGVEEGEGVLVGEALGLADGEGEAAGEGEAEGESVGVGVGVVRTGDGDGVAGAVCEYTTMMFDPVVAGVDCCPLLRVTMIW